jgi:hypothetical protein
VIHIALLRVLIASDELEYLDMVHHVIHGIVERNVLIAASNADSEPGAGNMELAQPAQSQFVGIGIAGLMLQFQLLHRLHQLMADDGQSGSIVSQLVSRHSWAASHFYRNLILNVQVRTGTHTMACRLVAIDHAAAVDDDDDAAAFPGSIG